MARSKRNKVVSLTKTVSKGKDFKQKTIGLVRGAIDEYKHVFVLKFENMRDTKFKEIRMDWKESRIFLGKNKIAQVALGRNVEEEYKENLHLLSSRIDGNVGLLFTNRSVQEVKKYFDGYVSPEFANAGAIPIENIVIPTGIFGNFPVSNLEQFRKLGLVIEADNGQLNLKESFVAATKNVPLRPEQAKVLFHMNKPIINFKIAIDCHWADSKFSTIA